MVTAAAINWNTILQQAITAAQGVLGQRWQGVSQGAVSQITLLANSAEYIAENKDNMKPLEYKAIISNQALALQNVLLIYEDIGIAIAEEVVQAVWTAIGAALLTAAGIAIKV